MTDLQFTEEELQLAAAFIKLRRVIPENWDYNIGTSYGKTEVEAWLPEHYEAPLYFYSFKEDVTEAIDEVIEKIKGANL